VRLGALARVDRGASWSKNQERRDGTGSPVIRIANVQPAGLDLTEVRSVVALKERDLQRALIGPNSLLMVGSNGNPERVGNVYLADSSIGGMSLASFLIGIHATDHNRALWLYYYLTSQAVQEAITKATAGSTGLKNLSLEWLRSIPVVLPPLPIRLRIVDLMTHMDNHLANLRSERNLAEELLRSLRGELIAIDDSWMKISLGDVATIFDGPHATPKKTDVGPWYLSISSLKQGRMDLSLSAHIGADEYPQWTRRVKPEIGDILFSYETRLGEAAIWNLDEPAVLGRRMGLLRPKRNVVLPEFIEQAFLAPAFQREIEERAVRGSTVDRIPIAKMPKWPFPIPPMGAQSEIVATLTASQKFYETLAEEVNKLDALRTAILSDLLNGELEVESRYDSFLGEVA
jgi:type I restriction enzyme S subunit